MVQQRRVRWSVPVLGGLVMAPVMALLLLGGTSTAAWAATASATIHSNSFLPATMTVAQGTTVTWQNVDQDAHTVTSSTGAFDSGNVAAGQSWSFTFNTPGTYRYTCVYHGFSATVTVSQPAPTTTTSTTPPTTTPPTTTPPTTTPPTTTPPTTTPPSTSGTHPTTPSTTPPATTAPSGPSPSTAGSSPSAAGGSGTAGSSSEIGGNANPTSSPGSGTAAVSALPAGAKTTGGAAVSSADGTPVADGSLPGTTTAPAGDGAATPLPTTPPLPAATSGSVSASTAGADAPSVAGGATAAGRRSTGDRGSGRGWLPVLAIGGLAVTVGAIRVRRLIGG